MYNPAILVFLLLAIILAVLLARLPRSDSQLLFAARHNDTNAIVTLVQKGANVNAAIGDSGSTPLMVAASEGNEEAVKILLQLGANKDARNANGKSAVDVAFESGRTNIVRVLSAK